MPLSCPRVAFLGVVANAVALFSWLVFSGAANYAYPIRIRFPNIITGKLKWVTIGYVPIVKSDSEDNAEKVRVRILKDAVFQRCLAVLMHRFIPASQYGEPMVVPGEDDPVLAVPRVVLYAADQPEERRVLGLKLSGCKRPCSHCVVGKHAAACRGPRAGARDVLEHVELQLDAVEALEDGAGQARLSQIEGDSSIVPVVPVLAAVHGLGTGPCCLYKIFGFDMLHVRWSRSCSVHVIALRVRVLEWNNGWKDVYCHLHMVLTLSSVVLFLFVPGSRVRYYLCSCR